jgi:GT2 family glycosyltransferase
MMTEPLVTVNILTYNRKDEVADTLRYVFAQDYQTIEVIVVDNASTDGTSAMIRGRFPAVRLITLPENTGIAGWNEGFAAASGDLVLVLDDNAYPHREAIGRCVDLFRNDTGGQVACIAFNIINLRTKGIWRSKWLPENRDLPGEHPVFVGCAFMLDMRKLQMKSVMPAHYFLYQNELAVSAMIHTRGFRIVYDPAIIGYHWFFEQTTYKKRNDLFIFQNNLYFILEFLPFVLAVLYSLQCLAFFAARSIRRRWFREYWSTVIRVAAHYQRNRPISMSYFFQLRKLHLFNFPLLSKVFRQPDGGADDLQPARSV